MDPFSWYLPIYLTDDTPFGPRIWDRQGAYVTA